MTASQDAARDWGEARGRAFARRRDTQYDREAHSFDVDSEYWGAAYRAAFRKSWVKACQDMYAEGLTPPDDRELETLLKEHSRRAKPKPDPVPTAGLPPLPPPERGVKVTGGLAFVDLARAGRRKEG